MIFLSSALAGSALGSLDGKTIEARINRDQSVDLSWADSATQAPSPGKDCIGRATWSQPNVELTWVCGATLTGFGDVVTQSWIPGEALPSDPLREEGVTWLTDTTTALLEAGSWEEARGLVARHAGRLQYAGNEEQRAEILLHFLEDLNRRTAERQLSNHPREAGLIALDFLQSPPVWEAERPWDYMERLRVGPPAGNRPSPERALYLPVSPASLGAVTALAQTLEMGAETKAAVEIGMNLVAVAPKHAPGHLVLADALWRQGSVEAARQSYEEAQELGLTPDRAAKRLKP